jgi:hypothetical protein
MFAYIQRRLAEGAISVTESEVLAAVIPADQPQLRFRPAYRYGLERLQRRLMINAVVDRAGTRHYFIGDAPSPALWKLRDR